MPKCSYCMNRFHPSELVSNAIGDPICKECDEMNISVGFTKKGFSLTGKWGDTGINSFCGWDKFRRLSRGKETAEENSTPLEVIEGGKE